MVASGIGTRLLKRIIEGNMEYGTGRRGIRRKQLLYGRKEARREWKLKDEGPVRTVCRIRFEPVLKQSKE